jgi:hypothetical protein
LAVQGFQLNLACLAHLNSINVGVRVSDVPQPSLRRIFLIKSGITSQILHENVTGSVIVNLKLHLNRSYFLPNLIRVHFILQRYDSCQNLSLPSTEFLDRPSHLIVALIVLPHA